MNEKRVRVYWNIQKRLWSVQHDGRVIHRLELLYLRNCKFIVQPGGRARTLAKKVKRIHAFVEGDFDESIVKNVDVSDMLPGLVGVTYNPYKNETFVLRDGGLPISGSEIVVLTRVYNKETGHRANVYAVHPGTAQAMVEYGGWHLPTLEMEYERFVAGLKQVNPERGWVGMGDC